MDLHVQPEPALQISADASPALGNRLTAFTVLRSRVGRLFSALGKIVDLLVTVERRQAGDRALERRARQLQAVARRQLRGAEKSASPINRAASAIPIPWEQVGGNVDMVLLAQECS